MLRTAKRPVILTGRVSRDLDAWKARVALAEAVNARVATDLKVGAAFPTDHPLHVGSPGTIGMTLASRRSHPRSRCDFKSRLGGCCRNAEIGLWRIAPSARIVQVSVDHHLHNGWSMDYQGLPPVDVFIDCEPDVAVPALVAALGPAPFAAHGRTQKGLP